MIVTLKEASEEVGIFDIVEAPGNGRAITIPTNEPRILSAHQNTENVNAKLTPPRQQHKRPVGHEEAGYRLSHSRSESHLLLDAEDPLG
jgi:hypothetical protein